MSEQKTKSILYYLLPAFFGIIGGIIGWAILRKSDSKKARNCIIIGFIILAFTILFSIVTETFDISVGSYIETYGVGAFLGGMSVYVVPPIFIAYYIIKKIQHRTKNH